MSARQANPVLSLMQGAAFGIGYGAGVRFGYEVVYPHILSLVNKGDEKGVKDFTNILKGTSGGFDLGTNLGQQFAGGSEGFTTQIASAGFNVPTASPQSESDLVSSISGLIQAITQKVVDIRSGEGQYEEVETKLGLYETGNIETGVYTVSDLKSMSLEQLSKLKNAYLKGNIGKDAIEDITLMYNLIKQKLKTKEGQTIQTTKIVEITGAKALGRKDKLLEDSIVKYFNQYKSLLTIIDGYKKQKAGASKTYNAKTAQRVVSNLNKSIGQKLKTLASVKQILKSKLKQAKAIPELRKWHDVNVM